jgi:hypothetical protein
MPLSKAPSESLALDLAGLLPHDRKCNLILVVVNRFSGYTQLFHVFQKIHSKQTTQNLLNNMFTIQGFSLSIVSGRDSRFNLHFWQLMQHLQIEYRITFSYHYQTNVTICQWLYNFNNARGIS